MKKEVLYLSIAGGFVLVIFIVLLFIQSASNKPTAQTSTPQNAQPTSSVNNLPPISNGPLSPEQTSKAFYSWYLFYSGDPLTSGAYKNSPYLTASFKQLIQEQISQAQSASEKNDLVLCSQNRKSNVSYELATAKDFPNSDKEVVVYIRDATADGKRLHSFRLDKINDTWQIEDIACAP